LNTLSNPKEITGNLSKTIVYDDDGVIPVYEKRDIFVTITILFHTPCCNDIPSTLDRTSYAHYFLKMKKVLCLFLISLALAACTAMSNEEMSICKAMGLRKNDAVYIKKITGETINDFIIDSPYVKKNMIKGLQVKVDFDKTGETRELLSGYFKEREYLVFQSKEHYNYNKKKNVLGIIKSTDHYDIIRVQKTADRGKNLTTGMIIDRLKQWEQICRFTITGADSYWIQAQFIEKPLDMEEFSREVTDFCPELLNDGTGKIEDIIARMERDNSFYLFF
jgi:hypothetical protein